MGKSRHSTGFRASSPRSYMTRCRVWLPWSSDPSRQTWNDARMRKPDRSDSKTSAASGAPPAAAATAASREATLAASSDSYRSGWQRAISGTPPSTRCSTRGGGRGPRGLRDRRPPLRQATRTSASDQRRSGV